MVLFKLILLFFISFIIIILLSVIRVLFGARKMWKQMKNSTSSNTSHEEAKSNPAQHTTAKPKDSTKKIFNNDEGEYVDFEEIKD